MLARLRLFLLATQSTQSTQTSVLIVVLAQANAQAALSTLAEWVNNQFLVAPADDCL